MIPAREPLIRVEDFSKSYVGVRALSGVSVEIMPAEIHALCGENGAGKSTLIKVLTGSVRPEAGRVMVEGSGFCDGERAGERSRRDCRHPSGIGGVWASVGTG